MAAAIIILVLLGLMDLMLFVACFEMEKDEEVRRQMSWYSDKESFNEYDDPYCVWKSTANGGKCGNSKEECEDLIRRSGAIKALRLEYPMMPFFKELREEWDIKTEGYRKAEEVINEVPTIKTKQIKYYDEDENVWKVGEVIVDE